MKNKKRLFVCIFVIALVLLTSTNVCAVNYSGTCLNSFHTYGYINAPEFAVGYEYCNTCWVQIGDEEFDTRHYAYFVEKILGGYYQRSYDWYISPGQYSPTKNIWDAGETHLFIKNCDHLGQYSMHTTGSFQIGI